MTTLMGCCLAASALSNLFVLIAWRHRFRSDISRSKFRVHSVDFSTQPVPSIVVTESSMRRPDKSKLSFLRLRSPKEKGSDNDRLKSPTGVYTGEPVPLLATSPYPWRRVALLLTLLSFLCLFLSGAFTEVAPAVFPLAPPMWPTDFLFSNGQKVVMPKFPRIQKMFHNDRSFQDTGVQGDIAWRDILPEGHGVVELRWPEHLKLPKSAHYYDNSASKQKGIELAEVSVVKELDCLIKIRSALIGYGYNMRLNENMNTEVHACLDYLRQAILCSSDTTMEAAWNSTSISASGSGEEVFETERVAHTCKDWGKVRLWLEQNRKGKR